MRHAREKRILRRNPGVHRERLLQRAVIVPANAVLVEPRGDFRSRQGAEHFFHERHEPVPMEEAGALIIQERKPKLLLERGDLLLERERRDEARPLSPRDRDEHDPFAIRRHEIATEGAEKLIAHSRPVGARDRHLGDLPEMAERRDGEIAERHADLATLSGPVPARDRPRAARRQHKRP